MPFKHLFKDKQTLAVEYIQTHKHKKLQKILKSKKFDSNKVFSFPLSCKVGVTQKGTLLFVAIDSGCQICMETLIANGANVYITCENFTALHQAIRKCVSLLKTTDCMEILCSLLRHIDIDTFIKEYRASVDPTIFEWNYPPNYAATFQIQSLLKVLFEAGFPVIQVIYHYSLHYINGHKLKNR